MKNLNPEKSNAGRRAASYWFGDGLPEIVLGVPLILTGAAGVLSRLYLGPGLRVLLYVAPGACLAMVVVLFHRQVLDPLKARITYPRTGYVRPPTPATTRPHQEVLGLHLDRPGAPASDQNVTRFPWLIVMALGGMGNPTLALGGAWGLPVVMVAISAVVYVFFHDSEHEYSLWSVLPLAASGFLPLAMDTPDRIFAFLPWLFVGIWLLLRGAWTLTRYLDRHPRPQGMEQLPK